MTIATFRSRIAGITLAALTAALLSACVAVVEQPGSSTSSTYNSGYNRSRTVPRIEGLTLDQAEAELGRAGLRLGSVSREADRHARGGTILWQDPEPYTSVSRGSSVDIVVAKAYARVPHLRGLSLKQARRAARDAGFVLGEVREHPDRRAPYGSVIRQRPKPTTLAEQGQALDIVIAQGPTAAVPPAHGSPSQTPHVQKPHVQKPHVQKPGPSPTVVDVLASTKQRVPQLRGLSLKQAELVLRDSGLELGEVKRKTTGKHPRGTVIAQYPKPKSKVARGTRVTLEVARSPKQNKPESSPGDSADPPPQSGAARTDGAAQEAGLIVVPGLLGYSQGAAARALSAAGLQLGKVSYTHKGDGGINTVTEQRPRPFERVAPGTRVNIVIKERRD